MREVRNIHVGPYAEWVTTKHVHDLPNELLWSLLEAQDWGGLMYHRDAPTVLVDGVEHFRWFWSPFYYDWTAKSPPRRFAWGDRGEFVAQDLSAVDRAAEVQWFREEFREQLAALAREFASPPALHWGIVCSVGGPD